MVFCRRCGRPAVQRNFRSAPGIFLQAGHSWQARRGADAGLERYFHLHQRGHLHHRRRTGIHGPTARPEKIGTVFYRLSIRCRAHNKRAEASSSFRGLPLFSFLPYWRFILRYRYPPESPPPR